MTHKKPKLRRLLKPYLSSLLPKNTSLGIAVLRMLSLMAGKILGPSYDISIIDMHHRNKADAPSGTSLSIAQTLTGLDHLKKGKPPYLSHSPRPEKTIEIASVRGGNIISNHEVIFSGEAACSGWNIALTIDRSLRKAQSKLPSGLWASQQDSIR